MNNKTIMENYKLQTRIKNLVELNLKLQNERDNLKNYVDYLIKKHENYKLQVDSQYLYNTFIDAIDNVIDDNNNEL